MPEGRERAELEFMWLPIMTLNALVVRMPTVPGSLRRSFDQVEHKIKAWVQHAKMVR